KSGTSVPALSIDFPIDLFLVASLIATAPAVACLASMFLPARAKALFAYKSLLQIFVSLVTESAMTWKRGIHGYRADSVEIRDSPNGRKREWFDDKAGVE